MHACVERDDQIASVALLACQERPIERARHHRPKGWPTSPYFAIAMRMNSKDHRGELLWQHVKAPPVRVDAQTSQGSAPANRLALGREWHVESASLHPHLLHLQSAAVEFPAHSAATLEAYAVAVLRGRHDEDEVVDPRRHVN